MRPPDPVCLSAGPSEPGPGDSAGGQSCGGVRGTIPVSGVLALLPVPAPRGLCDYLLSCLLTGACRGRCVGAGRAIVVTGFGEPPDPPAAVPQASAPLCTTVHGGLPVPSPTAAQATPAALHGVLPPLLVLRPLACLEPPPPELCTAGFSVLLFFPPELPRRSFREHRENGPTQGGRTLF